MIKLSYSKVETYKDCPAKYKFQYIDRLSLDITSSALLFGGAFDTAINYVLKQHKKAKSINVAYAKKAFLKSMRLWHGQNELVFFKADLAPEARTGDGATDQKLAWDNLCSLGQLMIDEYVTNIIPQFKRVIEVQRRKVVKNEAGDTFTFVLDCIVELMDGRVALLDTKTSSKPYTKNSVRESTQLAAYNEFYPVPYCGYVVFNKKLANGKVTWQMIVDKVNEKQKEKVFLDIDDALSNIKQQAFGKNKKSCFKFGRRCDFYLACHYGNQKGLIQRK